DELGEEPGLPGAGAAEHGQVLAEPLVVDLEEAAKRPLFVADHAEAEHVAVESRGAALLRRQRRGAPGRRPEPPRDGEGAAADREQRADGEDENDHGFSSEERVHGTPPSVFAEMRMLSCCLKSRGCCWCRRISSSRTSGSRGDARRRSTAASL